MPDDERARAHSEQEYLWLSPNEPMPLGALERVLLAIQGSAALHDTTIDVTYKAPNSPSTTYRGMRNWEQNLDGDPDIESVYASSRLALGDVSLSADVREAVVTVSFDAAVPEVQRLGSLASKSMMESGFALAPSNRNELYEQSERLAVDRLPSIDDLKDAISRLQATVRLPRFEARIEQDGVSKTKRSERELLDYIGQADNLQRLNLYLSGRYAGIDVSVSFEDSTVTLSAAGMSEDQVLAMLATAKAALASGASGVEDRSLTGESRMCAFSVSPDQSWFASMVNSLRAADVPGQPQFHGRLRYAKTGDDRIETYQDLDQMTRAVEGTWDELGEIFLSGWWRSGLEITIRWDVPRELIELGVNARSLEAARKEFRKISTALSIAPVKQPVYRVRTTEKLELRTWRNEKLGDALAVAVQQFVSERCAIPIADVRANDGSVESFGNLDAFLRRISSEKKAFVEMHFYAEGPRGNALGVDIEPAGARTTLRIRSSLAAPEFGQLKKALLADLPVRKLETSTESSDNADAEKGGRLAKYLLPAVAAVLGFVLSPAFFSAASPTDTLAITFPTRGPTGVAELTVTTFRVEWAVEHQQWFRKTTDRSSSASLRVLRDGELLQEMRGAKPGQSVTVSQDGTYTLEVVQTGTDVSDRLQLSVKQ